MEWSVLEGQRLDSTYQLDKLIGTGSFGGVFNAGHYVAGLRVRRVAVKVIPRRDRDAAFQLRELIAAANLRHDAIVTSYSPGEADIAFGTGKQRLFYIVMELARGSLHGRLRRGALPEAECLIVAARI